MIDVTFKNFLIIAALFVLLYYIYQNEKRYRVLRYFGAIIICYGLGFVMGCVSNYISNGYFSFIKNLSIAEVCLLISLPLLLLETVPQKLWKSSPQMIKAFVLSILTVSVSVVILGLFVRGYSSDMPYILSGVAAIFTGGSANLGALYLSLKMEQSLFNQIFTADFLTGALYLFFSLTLCKINLKEKATKPDTSLKSSLFSKIAFYYIAYTLSVVGICLGASLLLFGEIQSTFVVLALTILSIILSNKLPLSQKSRGATLGEFFLMAFCFFIGLQMNLEALQSGILPVVLIFASVLILNSALYCIGCRLLKISFAEAFIAHIASIFGPPFVIILGKHMKRTDLIAVGIALGSIGIAIGTFIGMLIYSILT